VRHPFQDLPGRTGRARPVVDLVIEGLALAPQACLIDTGATEIRMGQHVAEIAGLATSDLAEDIIVGGLRTAGRAATVQLELRQGADTHVWSPTVFFCDPWPWAFGLLGLGGLDPFVLTINAYDEWSQLMPR